MISTWTGSLLFLLFILSSSRCHGQDHDPSQDFTRVKRIVNGYIPENLDSYGYVVSFQELDNGELKHYCGGSHIGNGWILTAGHCMYGKMWRSIYVRIGVDNLSTSTVTGAFKLRRVFFNNYSPLFMSNDIALVRIETYRTDLPSIQIADKKFTGPSCDIGGFGAPNFNSPASDSFHVAQVQVVPVVRCLLGLGFIVIPSLRGSIICAGGGLADTCQGDSGTGLICNGTLAGLTSYGRDCGVEGVPAVYTDVQKFSGWISRMISENE